ncbi:XdhC family protein [Citreimonas sp.]|uniref:XdhC family protein n=1 Tax=Citreimonas sp. TaxID=3036715 RepID=UPI0040598094
MSAMPFPVDRKVQSAIDRLMRAETPFAVATVIRTLDATAAKPGARALLDATGAVVEGWIGGGCARAAVAGAVREAIETGQPRLISLQPEELLEASGVAAGEERQGVRFARNGCPSKGSMDIFVEPVLPRARLAICGASPVAQALADLAGRFDFHRTLCAPDTTPEAMPEVDAHRDAFDAPEAGFLVIATQGKGDMDALRAAARSQASYVAFVGSRRKFATLAAKLEDEGVPRDWLDRVHAPAGLDIKAITPDEIALSILAEVIAARRDADRAGTAA